MSFPNNYTYKVANGISTISRIDRRAAARKTYANAAGTPYTTDDQVEARLLLYVYTGQIAFAAISSTRGVGLSKDVQNGHSEGEPKPMQDPEGLNSPLPPVALTTVQPCSPKSVYFLANKVGLAGLCDIAFEYLWSNLDENNIVEELFSPFTAEHKDIREREHDLFCSKLKPLVDRTLLFDIIEDSCLGEHPHRAAAMELVLERSIQQRRERMLVKVKDPQPDPNMQHQSSEDLTPKLQPPTPATQPPSQSKSKPVVVSASPKTSEASRGLSTVPEPGKEIKGVRRKKSVTKITTNPSTKDTRTCDKCGDRIPPGSWSHALVCIRRV
ncbi:hypothetical protein BJ322DRAFT_1103824 [Thelephora terrestris]|uniref:Uncharacterized protein n=1 Tax=Thelephora terrestris TaxID=56493 RepID=A0A9P6HRR8_9AGAM|nr:hypothetical protein BJ322DRAFT_1103824 [Thelephora terrestris]